MIVIALVCYWLLNQSSKALLASLVFLLIMITSFNLSYVKTLHQNKLIVYSIPGKTAIDIIKGRECHFIGDSDLTQKSFLQNFHLLPSRIMHGVSLNSNFPVSDNSFSRIEFGNKSMILLLKPPLFHIDFNTKADYLLVGKACRSSPVQLLKMVTANTIILDASLPVKYQTQWQIATDSLHLRLHLMKQGAFVANL
jgi:competence protein ComEC